MTGKTGKSVLCLVVVFAAIGSGGCGSRSPFKTVPVSGTVTYKNKPVANATVVFVLDNAPRRSYGTTNQAGEFKLTTQNTNDGALVGEHKVGISLKKPTSNSTIGQEMDASNPGDAYAQAMANAAQGKPEDEDELPSKYANPDTSGLVRTVVATGENHFKIDLD